jgi:hypothetical protein
MAIDKKKVKTLVGRLFADGKTPLERFGLDGDKISAIERRHPEIAKLGPMSKRVM